MVGGNDDLTLETLEGDLRAFFLAGEPDSDVPDSIDSESEDSNRDFFRLVEPASLLSANF